MLVNLGEGWKKKTVKKWQTVFPCCKQKRESQCWEGHCVAACVMITPCGVLTKERDRFVFLFHISFIFITGVKKGVILRRQKGPERCRPTTLTTWVCSRVVLSDLCPITIMRAGSQVWPQCLSGDQEKEEMPIMRSVSAPAPKTYSN